MSTNECCENMNPINCEEKKCGSPIINNYYGYGCCDNSNDSAGGNNNGHSPYIGENGTWIAWDPETNAVVDTDVRAEGPQGPAGINMSLNYSSTEHIVGSWIDGKPLYEKYVDFGLIPQGVTSGVVADKYVSVSISNASRVWISEAHVYDSEGITSCPIPCVSADAVNSPNNYVPRLFAIWVDRKTATSVDIGMQNSVGLKNNGHSAWCVIRYTKTTDSTT